MASENLYVIKRTFIDPKSPTETTYQVSLPATFTDLDASKVAARAEQGLFGYEKDFFPVWHINNGKEEWPHGDGVIVYAQGPSNEIFKVEIETVPNICNLEPDKSCKVQGPLFHVLQTIIYYNQDRSGANRQTILEGTHVVQAQAQAQALTVLLGDDLKKEDFAEYDEYVASGVEQPFGDDVLVHAVKSVGENILVSVISS